jgi:hypothetical protein
VFNFGLSDTDVVFRIVLMVVSLFVPKLYLLVFASASSADAVKPPSLPEQRIAFLS